MEQNRHREMEGVDVYSTAKSEYTEQFCLFLVPALQSFFLGLIEEAKEKEKDQRRILWMFQNLLKDIPDWNQDKVLRETEKISQTTRCDYLEELLTAVFIAHTKVLSAIRLTNREKKKIQISVPKIEHFLHRTLSESARILWSNAYLFSEQGTSIERQKNLRQVEQLLHQAVLQSIRGMLPVKNILREYLNNDTDGDEGDADEKEAEKEEVEKEEAEDEKEEKEEETKPEKEEKEEGSEKEIIETESNLAIDLSGVQMDVSGTVIVESTETPNPPPNTPEAPVTVPSEQPNLTPQPQQVLVFETEPSVKFAEHDMVFDSENQESHRVRSKSADMDNDDDDDENIHILDSAPEAMDDFEDLESGKPESIDDFETLE